MDELASLWKQYKDHHSAQAREGLIVHYVKLVRYVVDRMNINLPQSLQKDDLVGYGVLGLMEAIERFDPNQNIKFSTYAYPRIRGQIVDSLREIGLFSRTTYQRIKQIEQAIAELNQTLGRTPTDNEVATHLNTSLTQYLRWLVDANLTIISLDQPSVLDNGEFVPLYDTLEDTTIVAPTHNLDEIDMKSELISAIQVLPQREQMVISLYYMDDLTMKEIGKVLDVSESRVSQMHAKAILTLKGWIKQQAEPNSVFR